MPILQRLLPEDRAVEAVAGDQRPVGRQEDVVAQSFVDDVEDPAAGGDHGVHAGHEVVVAQPLGLADPLDPARRTDHRVAADHRALRVVMEVRPLVDLLGPGLDDPLFAHHGHAAGSQHAQEFFFVP